MPLDHKKYQPLPPQPLCCLRHYQSQHPIITCLSSWFGIHGSVLNWFKSYLSSHSFHVKCKTVLSSLYCSTCGIPKVHKAIIDIRIYPRCCFLVYQWVYATPGESLLSCWSQTQYNPQNQKYLAYHNGAREKQWNMPQPDAECIENLPNFGHKVYEVCCSSLRGVK